jgi:DNA-binding transcriptional LysR family regulator
LPASIVSVDHFYARLNLRHDRSCRGDQIVLLLDGAVTEAYFKSVADPVAAAKRAASTFLDVTEYLLRQRLLSHAGRSELMPSTADLAPSDLTHLRAFLVVAERLSFSQAADAMGVKPSALSHTIRALEARLGVQLFNRTTRSVALTPAGRALAARLGPAMQAIGGALSDVRRIADRPSGTVRLVATRMAARLEVAPALARFAAAAPDVVLDLTVTDANINFVAEGFDAALRPGEVIDQDMVSIRIGPDHRQIAVASPAYLEKHGRPIVPEDLHQHRCIRWRWAGRETPYAWEFRRDGDWFEVAVTGPFIVDDREVAISAALVGAGIAFATEREVEGYLLSGQLEALMMDWTDTFPGYHLCYPKQRQMPPSLRVLIDVLRGIT